MKIELIGGPSDGYLVVVPEGTTFFEVSIPDIDAAWKPVIHRYEKRDIMTRKAPYGFVHVGIRQPSRRSSRPGIG